MLARLNSAPPMRPPVAALLLVREALLGRVAAAERFMMQVGGGGFAAAVCGAAVSVQLPLASPMAWVRTSPTRSSIIAALIRNSTFMYRFNGSTLLTSKMKATIAE